MTANHTIANRIEDWSVAVAANDVERIAEFITDDWVLVTPESGIVTRERFLDSPPERR